MLRIIGREPEKVVLAACLASERPEFLAVYGRRRVGKTFLIREYFGDSIVFSFSGSASASPRRQLESFVFAALSAGSAVGADIGGSNGGGSGNVGTPLHGGAVRDWFRAFELIKPIIQASPKKKKVVFIDELPWLATPKSEFVSALEFFWNNWGSARGDLLLVVCGSAASWLVEHVIHEHGGLYGRVTRQMRIEPFNLCECEAYCRARGIELTRYQIAELYMALGGIPYYMDYLEPGLSPAQCLDRMFFANAAPLAREFEDLYASLFRRPENHVRVVEALGGNADGLPRGELLRKAKLPSGGQFTKVMRDLEQCGFVENVQGVLVKGARVEKRYRLCDFFTLFYYKHMRRNRTRDPRYWSNRSLRGELQAWYGLAFERLCMAHTDQIKRKLGIAGVATAVSAWRDTGVGNAASGGVGRGGAGGGGAQIDMVIDRDDGIVNLCEMKFVAAPFVIDKAYDARLRARREAFRERTGTRKALHTTLVTTFGVARNSYYGEIQAEVTLDDLFSPSAP